ncbi:hypothetical protein T11_10510, partial [Trichinella zimbabwensis]
MYNSNFVIHEAARTGPQTVIIFSHEASTRSGAGYVYGDSNIRKNTKPHASKVPDACARLPKEQGKSSHSPLSKGNELHANEVSFIQLLNIQVSLRACLPFRGIHSCHTSSLSFLLQR